MENIFSPLCQFRSHIGCSVQNVWVISQPRGVDHSVHWEWKKELFPVGDIRLALLSWQQTEKKVCPGKLQVMEYVREVV